MTKEQRQNMQEAATVLACGTFCLVVLGFFLYEPWRSSQFWFGDKPRIEFVFSAGTLVAAVVAGLLAYFSYRVNIRADLASRLQKALDLMDGGSPGKGAAAVALLVEVAKESNRFRRPVLDALMAYLIEYSAEQMQHLRVAKGVLTYTGDFAASNYNTNEIVRGISAINELGDEEISVDETALFSLHAYLCGFWYIKLNLSGMVFSRAVMSNMTFDECNLAGTRIHAVAGEYVGFRGCDVSHMSIDLFKPDGSRISAEDELAIFFHCKGMESAVVNGRSATLFEFPHDPWPTQRG